MRRLGFSWTVQLLIFDRKEWTVQWLRASPSGPHDSGVSFGGVQAGGSAQMPLDGHSVPSVAPVAQRLELASSNLFYR
jgi:hypothetical protein